MIAKAIQFFGIVILLYSIWKDDCSLFLLGALCALAGSHFSTTEEIENA